MRPMQWVRLWVMPHLAEDSCWKFLNLEQRGLFHDGLLVLAGHSNNGGQICLQGMPNVPYTDEQLASILCLPLDVFRRVLASIPADMVCRDQYQCIVVLNWSNYQTEYERQKGYRTKLHPKVTGTSRPQKSEVRSQKSEEQKEKSDKDSASASPNAPRKAQRHYSDEERTKIDKNVGWFYARYRKAVGSHSPQEPKPGRFPHPADARAALKLSGLLAEHKPDRVDAMLKDWLAGKYLSVPGDTLACFVSVFGKLLNPASRKREWVNETPGSERRTTGGGGFKRVGDLLPPEARNAT